MAIDEGGDTVACVEKVLLNASLINQTCLPDDEQTIVPLPSLMNTDFSLATLYISIMAVALFIGTFGNILILMVAGMARGLNKIGKEFMVNLALADLCVSAIADPMCIIGVVKGEHFFNGIPWLCQSVASLCLTACFCAFASLSMLSLNRYIYLCHNNVYDRLYGRKTCIALCFMCWVFAVLCEFPNFLGWGGHYFDQKSHQCIWDRTSSISYTMFVAFGLIGFPLLTMMVCFILIFRRIWNTKKALYEVDMSKDQVMGKVMSETARTAKTIFVIFLVFVVCWTPYALVIAIDIEDKLPMKVHLFVTLLAHLHSSSTFVIYFVSNKRFRVALARIFGCYSEMSSLPTSSETKSSNITTRISQDEGYTKCHQAKIQKTLVSTRVSAGSNTSTDSGDCHM